MATEHVLIFDSDPARAAKIAALLEQNQPPNAQRSVLIFQDLKSITQGSPFGVSGVPKNQVALAVIVESSGPNPGFSGLAELAHAGGVATLGIIDASGSPLEVARRAQAFDAWMALDSLDRELPIRVAAFLDPTKRSGSGSGRNRLPTIDPRFLSVVIHDLRTPLNVIIMTIRAITQTIPERSPELDEDLTFLNENAWQIEKMLWQLVEYGRLIDGDAKSSTAEFEPRRFLSDFIEVYRSKAGSKALQIHLELTGTSPAKVNLDQTRALLALQQSLGNALNAAGNTPVWIRSSSQGGRWIIEMIVDKPPPEKVDSLTLRSDLFERLEGVAGERRGLDLAIAARVSELFGGSARLVVEPGRRSTVILDWPETPSQT